MDRRRSWDHLFWSLVARECWGGSWCPGCATAAVTSGLSADVDVLIIVHLAGSAKGDDVKARVLMEAAAGAGVLHVVFISVVGADEIPVGYFRAKHAAEQLIADSGVPWTTMRATQIHDLVLKVTEKMTRLPVAFVPSVRLQPVDAAEVADGSSRLHSSDLQGG